MFFWMRFGRTRAFLAAAGEKAPRGGGDPGGRWTATLGSRATGAVSSLEKKGALQILYSPSVRLLDPEFTLPGFKRVENIANTEQERVETRCV